MLGTWARLQAALEPLVGTEALVLRHLAYKVDNWHYTFFLTQLLDRGNVGGACAPECVAKGSGFTLGESGWRRVYLTPLLQPKPPATVRNNCAMAVPLGGTAKAATFGGFKRCITSFRMVRAALHDIPTCFITCQKLFCVTDVILFGRF